MKANTLYLKIAAISAMIVFAVGCSEFNAPTATESSESQISNTQYLPIEDVIANVEAMGYRVIPSRAMALDDQDCDTVSASRLCRTNSVSNITLAGIVALKVQGSVLPNDMEITVVAPARCMGVADFYPHPTQFNGNVTIRWDTFNMELPEGVEFDDIVPLYIHDDGSPEEVAFQHWNNRFISVETNHFSRYIITTKIVSSY